MTDHQAFCSLMNKSMNQAGMILSFELDKFQLDLLRRIVEIERAVEGFESEKYWTIEWTVGSEVVGHEENPFWNYERVLAKIAEIDGGLGARIVEKATRPPKRYMREDISSASDLEALYSGKYVVGRIVKPTSLGMAVVDLFDETQIRGKIINRDKIGLILLKAVSDTELQQPIGKCPLCSCDLVMKTGQYGQFIGCEGYPSCGITFPVPARAKIIPVDSNCKLCGYPIIEIIERGRGGRKSCINQDCSQNSSRCPKCGSELKIRESDYGKFYGCSAYPNCKYTKKS